MGTRRALAGLTATICVVAGTALASTSAHAGSTGFCSLPGFTAEQTFVWTGNGGDDLWSTAANWNHNATPGQRVDAEGADVQDQYVCIGRNANTTIPDVVLRGGGFGESAHITALDVGDDAQLTLTPGAQLYLSGNQATQPSFIRSNSTLDLLGSTLGGYGKVEVDGTLNATSQPGAATTITTRECDVGAGCPGALPGGPGLVEIGERGTLDINGKADGGINLEDSRQILNYGTIAMSGHGFIAADHGTVIDNFGLIELGKHGGIYEGRDHYGQAVGYLGNSMGRLSKIGSRTSVLASRLIGQGKITVQHGELVMNSRIAPKARIKGGGAYGIGACRNSHPPYSCPAPVPTRRHPQVALLQLQHSAGPATVLVRKAGGLVPAGTLGRWIATDIAGAHLTPHHAATVFLEFDRSLVGGRAPPDLRVDRYTQQGGHRVPHCTNAGTPPNGKDCVGVVGKAGHGDEYVAINTTRNGFSRWVVR